MDRPGQYAEPLRNLQAVYRRFCQEQGLARAFCANSALYAKPANALPSKVFSEVVDLASGDVVQLVRTLPCHGTTDGTEGDGRASEGTVRNLERMRGRSSVG